MAPNKTMFDVEIGTEGGEQKTFEVIDEEKVSSGHDFETPHMVRRGLTEVSAMFDRNGKGYLDDTERALRRMDSQNKGHLGIDKVCVIFESLQVEQERSAELLEALRLESKKALSLKRGVIALAVFAVLLAVANIGTSFAVSKLVKEMKVSSTGDLVALESGNRLGTTSKFMVFDVEDLESNGSESQRRALQTANNICETVNTFGTANTTDDEVECRVQGVMNFNKASNLHEALQDVSEVIMRCNGKSSTILGGSFASFSGVEGAAGGLMEMGPMSYRVFPDSTNTNLKYFGEQVVPYANGDCQASFRMAIYCPPASLAECFVMTASLPTVQCPVSPQICGPRPTPAPASSSRQSLASSRGGAGGAGAGAQQP